MNGMLSGQNCPRCYVMMIRESIPCPDGNPCCCVFHFRDYCPDCTPKQTGELQDVRVNATAKCQDCSIDAESIAITAAFESMDTMVEYKCKTCRDTGRVQVVIGLDDLRLVMKS